MGLDEFAFFVHATGPIPTPAASTTTAPPRRSDDRRHPAGMALRSLARVRRRGWGRPAIGTWICGRATLPGTRRGTQLRVAGQGTERVRAVGKATGRERRRN